jgi:outer membrane protein OmpA-like peptidoglycan-associated protein
VSFRRGSSDLEPAAMATLDQLAASLAKDPGRSIVVEGYTDNSGSKDKNLELSQRRADAVMQYLIAHGVPAASISAVGKGDAAPVASNASATGRQQNRRVNIVVS